MGARVSLRMSLKKMPSAGNRGSGRVCSYSSTQPGRYSVSMVEKENEEWRKGANREKSEQQLQEQDQNDYIFFIIYYVFF